MRVRQGAGPERGAVWVCVQGQPCAGPADAAQPAADAGLWESSLSFTGKSPRRKAAPPSESRAPASDGYTVRLLRGAGGAGDGAAGAPLWAMRPGLAPNWRQRR